MKLVKISNEYYLLDGEINDGDKILHEGDILTVNKNKGAYLSTYCRLALLPHKCLIEKLNLIIWKMIIRKRKAITPMCC